MSNAPFGEVALQAAELAVHFHEHVVFEGVDLTVKRGEIVSVLGANGVGKTTLLRALAGLPVLPSQHTEGKLRRSEAFAFVHQQYQASLLPWYTARRNILLGPAIKRPSGQSFTEDLEAELATFGFGGRLPLDRRPEQLSGGQRQMVALARALVLRRPLLFLDEPISALDKNAQVDFATHLRQSARMNGWAIIAVLHDAHLAAFLSDRCVALAGKPAKVVMDLQLPEEERGSIAEFLSSESSQTVINRLAEAVYA